jgi:hypothetical protein
MDPGKSARHFEVDACLRAERRPHRLLERGSAPRRGLSLVPGIVHEIGRLRAALQRGARADGRRDRSPVRVMARRVRRRTRRVGDDHERRTDSGRPKNAAAHDHAGEPSPRVVQLAARDPEALAEAARRNIDLGAQIIDINMGCPAKKSATACAAPHFSTDETLVAKILEAVVPPAACRDVENAHGLQS